MIDRQLLFVETTIVWFILMAAFCWFARRVSTQQAFRMSIDEARHHVVANNERSPRGMNEKDAAMCLSGEYQYCDDRWSKVELYTVATDNDSDSSAPCCPVLHGTVNVVNNNSEASPWIIEEGMVNLQTTRSYWVEECTDQRVLTVVNAANGGGTWLEMSSWRYGPLRKKVVDGKRDADAKDTSITEIV